MSKSERTRRRVRFPHIVGVFIAAALLAPAVSWANHDFPDVPNDNQFHDEISWLAGTNITGGFGDGTYKPSQAVTRGSMAAFIQRTYRLLAGNTRVDTGEDGGSADANTGTWQNVTGASISVTIPEGVTGRIVTTFAGDAFCNSGDNIFVLVLVVRPQCLGRINVAGAPAPVSLPDEVSLLDSDDAAVGDAPDAVIDSEGFSMTATSAVLNPGTYTVTAQFNTADSNPANDPVAFEVNDYILTTTVALNDPPLPL